MSFARIFLGILASTTITAAASADVTHVVARGHTVETIAARYHVSAHAIIEANHLKDPKHLRIGSTLTIPGVEAKPKNTAAADHSKAKKGAHERPVTYAMRAKTPGVVHAARLATSEDFTVRVNDRRGRVSPTALKTFQKMMRSASGQEKAPDPRLVALVGIVSNHFGSRKLEVISGFRPFTPTQYTAHSNHNVGKAMDFRIVGVPNEVLRDYCKTLRNVGVGYYPNSTFVHLDVREHSAFWIDYSKPGEPPHYSVPNADADEGTSDVAEEPHGSTDDAPATPTPNAAPAPPAPVADHDDSPRAAPSKADPPAPATPSKDSGSPTTPPSSGASSPVKTP